MTRVFLVDDHHIVRRGVADLISADPDLEVKKTVKNYASRLLTKLGVERRTQSAVLAT